MKAIFDALNIVYDEEEKRGFLWLHAQSLIFTLAAISFVLLALASIVILPVVLDFVGLSTAVEWLLSQARWPILLAAVIAGLAVLYRYGQAATRPSGNG
jgi:membrane protein